AGHPPAARGPARLPGRAGGRPRADLRARRPGIGRSLLRRRCAGQGLPHPPGSPGARGGGRRAAGPLAGRGAHPGQAHAGRRAGRDPPRAGAGRPARGGRGRRPGAARLRQLGAHAVLNAERIRSGDVTVTAGPAVALPESSGRRLSGWDAGVLLAANALAVTGLWWRQGGVSEVDDLASALTSASRLTGLLGALLALLMLL